MPVANTPAVKTPVVNARMYSVTPDTAAAWREVLSWVLLQADLDWPFVEHAAPAPIAALWARDDLGVAQMCGLPFAQRAPRPTLVAAPVPSLARYAGCPVYMTDLVVAADSPHRTLEDTFGGTVGFTLADSMSGGVAPLHHLAALRTPARPRLFRAAVGNLIHARGVIDALVAGRIDVGPLDGYSHDLLRASDPAFAAQVRAVATTTPRPVPPLVATAPLSVRQLGALRDALLAAHETPVLRGAMARLLVARFTVPDPADYEPLAALARADLPRFEDL
jgi:ABC-type phosphate/phosphonate transport system substrate-binding protein